MHLSHGFENGESIKKSKWKTYSSSQHDDDDDDDDAGEMWDHEWGGNGDMKSK